MRGLEKNCMGRGTRYDIHTTYGRTSRLLDQIGPVSRFCEKLLFTAVTEEAMELSVLIVFKKIL